MGDAHMLRQCRLKFLDLGAENKPPVIEDALNTGIDFTLQAGVLRFQVDKGNVQEGGPFANSWSSFTS